MKLKTPRTAKVIYTALSLALIIGLWLLFKEKSMTVEIYQIKRNSFQENLRVDGTIKSRTKVTVTAYASGDLGPVEFKVGDEIKKGQIISLLTWDIKKPVVSPIDGVVSKVYRESAGPILRGESIIDLIDPMNLEIVAEVLTTEAVRIPPQAPVKVSGVGSTEHITAHVSKVSKAGFVKLSALGIEEEKTEITMSFDKTPQTPVGDNFHVELLIQLSTENQVLTVPLGALFKNKDSWAVYIVNNQRAQLRNIAISKKNETEAITTDGLREGDTVILFPGDQISEGTKVEIRK